MANLLYHTIVYVFVVQFYMLEGRGKVKTNINMSFIPSVKRSGQAVKWSREHVKYIYSILMIEDYHMNQQFLNKDQETSILSYTLVF